MSKVGRNQPCPCGSGKKYKNCHGNFVDGETFRRDDGRQFLPDLQRILQVHAAEERLRVLQQGGGRPIIGTKFKGHQMVAVGNALHYSKNWRTFPDFLGSYIKRKMDPDWGNAEISKPLSERHPLMQWYDSYCRYQQETIELPGEVYEATTTGIVACYLGMAYALYLLDHNAELQGRLINRLKNVGNFQGAYYELIVASVLIRAGFELTLEDESGRGPKHCEFAALSKATGKRYSVEARMRSVPGLLGRTVVDGAKRDNPLGRLIPHLNEALQKPSEGERLIFIDLNAPAILLPGDKPDWLDPVATRLEQYEKRELKPGATAYVFVTNMAYHRQLDSVPVAAACPFGIGMPDFNRPGVVRLADWYRQKQKHIDAYDIGRSINDYLRFPTTFDGSLPSEALGGQQTRMKIGESYFFEDVGEAGKTGTVTAATVSETEKTAYYGVAWCDGTSTILRKLMSDSEMSEYLQFQEAYFGKVEPKRKELTDAFELFEWLMEAHKKIKRDKMLAFFSSAPAIAELELLSDDDLRLVYCEHLASTMMARHNASGSVKPLKAN